MLEFKKKKVSQHGIGAPTHPDSHDSILQGRIASTFVQQFEFSGYIYREDSTLLFIRTLRLDSGEILPIYRVGKNEKGNKVKDLPVDIFQKPQTDRALAQDAKSIDFVTKSESPKSDRVVIRNKLTSLIKSTPPPNCSGTVIVKNRQKTGNINKKQVAKQEIVTPPTQNQPFCKFTTIYKIKSTSCKSTQNQKTGPPSDSTRLCCLILKHQSFSIGAI